MLSQFLGNKRPTKDGGGVARPTYFTTHSAPPATASLEDSPNRWIFFLLLFQQSRWRRRGEGGGGGGRFQSVPMTDWFDWATMLGSIRVISLSLIVVAVVAVVAVVVVAVVEWFSADSPAGSW